MFSNNSRIEYNGGLRFYEKDVLVDNSIYNYDIEYFTTINYNSPGFGILLINKDSTVTSRTEYYLFRVGNKEMSIDYKLDSIYKTLKRSPINVAPPITNMMFSLSKKGKRITININNNIYTYVMPNNFDKYSIALYSNKGNVIKYVSANTGVPSNWIINMANINNGNIYFEDDSFTISNCAEKAYIEQDDIHLIPGDYYLNYSDTNSDITAEIISKNQNNPSNILDTNRKFTINSEQDVTLKFGGKNGTINNMYITNYISDSYVRTYGSGAVIDGSKIDLKLSTLLYFEITYSVNSFYLNDYFIINDGIKKYNILDLNMTINKNYTFKFYSYLNTLYIYNDDGFEVKRITMDSKIDSVELFYNTNGAVNNMLLKTKDGEEFNPVVFKTKMNAVPGAIISPIIVVDDNDVPFNLSSSYRIINNNGYKKYIFTNTEREYFSPDKHISLTNAPLNRDGSVKVYGIKENVDIDFEKMLTISEEGLDNIDNLTKIYDTIYEKDMQYIDKQNRSLYINNGDQYKLLIVDYIKEDSYCINYDYIRSVYVVDVSTSRDNYYTMYDYENSTDGTKQIQSMNKYYLTDITPSNNQYIILRRSELV